MTDCFETKSQPIRDELVHPTKILHYLCVIYKHGESAKDGETFTHGSVGRLG
ncbi:MAG: hypothetical protein WAT22_15575 [Saprospiraceae bacterium]